MKNLFDIKDKVIVITGGCGILGKNIANYLAEQGAKIVILDRAEEIGKQLEAELSQKTEALFLTTDVLNKDVLEENKKAIVERFGTIDVLVNNAGITKDGLIARMSEEQFDIVTSVNYKSVFNMIRHVTPVMMKQRSGRIINVSSVSGVYGNPGQFNYSATKAGIVGMTLTAAKELGGRNINVNAIAPGFIRTPMTDVLTDEQKKAAESVVALKRFGEPEEVASVVSFLAGPDSSYVSGQVIVIDGAMSI